MRYGFADNTVLVSVLSAFGLVLSLWVLLMLAWSLRRAMRIQRVERRLGLTDDEGRSRIVRLWHEGQETTTTVPDTRSSYGLWQRVENHFSSAGWQVAASSILMGLLGVVLMVMVLTWLLLGSLTPALIAGGTTAAMFYVYNRIRAERRVAAFERQFADALGMVARSLRAGQPLLAGLQLASQQLPHPVRDVFAEICQNHAFGETLEESIRRVGAKYNSQDLRLFTTAVIIQLQTGGNLADLMDRLAAVIRDRMKLGRRVRVLTAQTKLSSRILIALPFIVFLVVNLLNPQYMKPLFATSTGHLLLLGGGLSLLIGVMVMRWLTALRY